MEFFITLTSLFVVTFAFHDCSRGQISKLDVVNELTAKIHAPFQLQNTTLVTYNFKNDSCSFRNDTGYRSHRSYISLVYPYTYYTTGGNTRHVSPGCVPEDSEYVGNNVWIKNRDTALSKAINGSGDHLRSILLHYNYSQNTKTLTNSDINQSFFRQIIGRDNIHVTIYRNGDLMIRDCEMVYDVSFVKTEKTFSASCPQTVLANKVKIMFSDNGLDLYDDSGSILCDIVLNKTFFILLPLVVVFGIIALVYISIIKFKKQNYRKLGKDSFINMSFNQFG